MRNCLDFNNCDTYYTEEPSLIKNMKLKIQFVSPGII